MDPHPLYEYRPHEFTPAEKRFLGAAGWATVEAADLVELASVVDSERPPEADRVAHLTRVLMKHGLFAQRRRALAFARAYVELADAGADFRLLVWDWE